MRGGGTPGRKGTDLAHRIAYLLEYPTLSGGERSLLTLLERLDRDRFEPLLLAPPEGRLALRDPGAKPPPRALRGASRRWLRASSHGARLEDRPPPSLREGGPPARQLALDVLRQRRAGDEAGIPAIGHVRDIQRLTRMRIAELSRNRRVLCVSRATADNLVVQGLKSEVVERVPNAVDLEMFRPDGPGAGLREELMAEGWVGTRGTSSIEERWSPTKGGAMLGVSRTVKSEKMTGFEFLRVVERDGGLVYVAQPGGRTPTEFVLTALDKTRAVFVNPRHDYPQRIIYELSDEGALSASIGFAKGGNPRSFELTREGN